MQPSNRKTLNSLSSYTTTNTSEPPWAPALLSVPRKTRFLCIQHNPGNTSCLTHSSKQCQTYKSWEVILEPLFSQLLPYEPLLAQQALGHPGLLHQGADPVVAPDSRLRRLPEDPVTVFEEVFMDLFRRHKLTCAKHRTRGYSTAPSPACQGNSHSTAHGYNTVLVQRFRNTEKATGSSASKRNGWMDE